MLTVTVIPFVNEKHTHISVDVLLNDVCLDRLVFSTASPPTEGHWQSVARTILVPGYLLSETKVVSLLFAIREPKSPYELGISGDRRKLGLGLVQLRLSPA